MANEKILNTRIGLKVDTLENWNKSTLALKKGEVAFATVAATAGNGLAEPVIMMKIGEDGVKTFKDIEWNFYAKASDVLESAKSETALTNFINNLIANSGKASQSDLNALAGRVTTAEGAITTLNGDVNKAGSVAKSIKDAIDALKLSETYVAKESGKSLVLDSEITKLAGVSQGANKVEASTNGKIKIDGQDVTVYTHPTNHTVSEISDFDAKVKEYDYATKTEAQGYANAKDEAIAEAKKAGDDAQADVDALEIRVKAVEDDYLVEADKTELSGLITSEKERAEAAEAKALEDAKAYTDEVKAGILGEGITETFDTLKEIEDWINGAGVNATELTEAIAAEAKIREEADQELAGDIAGEAATREQADTALSGRIAKLENNDAGYATTGYVDQAELDAIATAGTNADTKIANHYKNVVTPVINAVSTDLVSHTTDGISHVIPADKEKWNGYEQTLSSISGVADAAKAQADTNKESIEAINNETTGILAKAKAYADSLDHAPYGVVADGGLKMEGNNFAIDDTITFVFDCGDAEVN